MPIAYKYRPGRGPIARDDNNNHVEIFERDLKLLAEDKIYIPTSKQLNDPTETLVDESQLNIELDLIKNILEDHKSVSIVEETYANFKKHIETSGIYSLSKTPTSELMWAYYANGHNGYAIMFDTDVLYESLNGGTPFSNIFAFDVKYVESLPSIDIGLLSKPEGNKFIEKFIGSKSKSWEHEQEYRLIFDKGGEVKQIDYRAIKGFVFGHLLPQEDIEYIMNLFKGRHLLYLKVRLNPVSYQFYTEEVEDLYKDAPKYHPNKVTYDFDKLLEGARLYCDAILEYEEVTRTAVEMVACEPFVKDIYLLSMYEDENNPGGYIITVGANYRNPSVVQPIKVFTFIVTKDKRLVKKE